MLQRKDSNFLQHPYSARNKKRDGSTKWYVFCHEERKKHALWKRNQ